MNRREGPLWLLLALALTPFAIKAASLAWFAQNYLAQSVYKLAQLAAPAGWRRQIDGRRGLACLWPIDEPLPSPATWALAVAIAAFSIASASVLVPWFAARAGLEPSALRAHFDEHFAMTPWRAMTVVAYLALINSALEELHFRAWLDRELSARWGQVAGVTASATAFAGMHTFIFARLAGLTAMMLAGVFVGLAVMAVLWSLLARRSGGIHAAWLSHGITDAGFLGWGLVWLGYFS
jgi:membrane protease YdiL (CAAX protease family)